MPQGWLQGFGDGLAGRRGREMRNMFDACMKETVVKRESSLMMDMDFKHTMYLFLINCAKLRRLGPRSGT